MSLIVTRTFVMALFSLHPLSLFLPLSVILCVLLNQDPIKVNAFHLLFYGPLVTYNRLNKSLPPFFSNTDLFDESRTDLLQISHIWKVFDSFS